MQVSPCDCAGEKSQKLLSTIICRVLSPRDREMGLSLQLIPNLAESISKLDDLPHAMLGSKVESVNRLFVHFDISYLYA